MLQSVRKYTQGWVATVMGIILSLAFVFWGIENYISGNNKKNLVAKINGKEITSSQLNNDMARMLLRLKDQFGSNFNLPPLMQEELKNQALTNLILENTLEIAAINEGFRVIPQQISVLIKQMPTFQVNGLFSKDRFEQIIQRIGYTKQEFYQDIEKNLLLNQVASGIIGSAFVLPNEINQAISLVEQKRDLVYTVIPAQRYHSTIKPTPEQLKHYYQQHTAAFKIPARLQIEYVLLSIEDLKKSQQISEQDIASYIETNALHIDRQDKNSMNKLKATLLQQKAEQAFLAASDKLTESAFTNPNSLKDVANAVNLNVNTSDYFTQEGGNNPITKNAKVIAAAFNPVSVKERINSNLIELSPGKVAVVRVKDYQAEGVAPLHQVKEKIKSRLVELLASQAAKDKGEELRKLLTDNKPLQPLLAKEKLNLIERKQISRHEKTVNSEILRRAFEVTVSRHLPVTLMLPNGDCVVLTVMNSKNLDKNSITQQQRATMTKLYSQTYGKVDYNLYVENKLKAAKIKIYNNAGQKPLS